MIHKFVKLKQEEIQNNEKNGSTNQVKKIKDIIQINQTLEKEHGRETT